MPGKGVSLPGAAGLLCSLLTDSAVTLNFRRAHGRTKKDATKQRHRFECYSNLRCFLTAFYLGIELPLSLLMTRDTGQPFAVPFCFRFSKGWGNDVEGTVCACTNGAGPFLHPPRPRTVGSHNWMTTQRAE